jgi:uncharacterized protein (TIGR03089 family)
VPTPPEVLAALLRSDPGRPRVTCYDDTDGPTRGERIELSARVLANWVSKAANALQDQWDLGPGSRVRLDLPAHWRTVYWAFAAWSVGATVVLPESDGSAPVDLLVTDSPVAAQEATSPSVLVTLAALARAAAAPVGGDTMDEARELATYADQFTAFDEPDPDDPALVSSSGTASYGAVVPAGVPVGVPAGAPVGGAPGRAPGSRVHLVDPTTGELLRSVLEAWAVDGSVVLSRGRAPADVLEARRVAEGVTTDG